MALLDSVPDLRTVMEQAPPDELSELFAAFDSTTTYDKDRQALRLAATLSPGDEDEAVTLLDVYLERANSRARMASIGGD